MSWDDIFFSIDTPEDIDWKKDSKRNECHRISDKTKSIFETKCWFYIEDCKKYCIEYKRLYEQSCEFISIYFFHKNEEKWTQKNEIEQIVIRVIDRLFERSKKRSRVWNILEKTWEWFHWKNIKSIGHNILFWGEAMEIFIHSPWEDDSKYYGDKWSKIFSIQCLSKEKKWEINNEKGRYK